MDRRRHLANRQRRGGAEQPPEIVWVYRTPLVSREWQSTDPITVVIQDTSWQEPTTDAVGQQVISGILYPIMPDPGQRSWLSSTPYGTKRVDWYKEKAKFKFNPGQFYLLTQSKPNQLSEPFYNLLLWLSFAIAIILVTNFLAWYAGKEAGHVKGKNRLPRH